MTTTSWTAGLHAAGVNRHCTRVEIKPYTSSGVQDGINQLLGAKWARIPNPACAPGQPLKLFLIAYQLQSTPSTDTTIRVLPVTPAVRAVISRRGWTLAKLPFRLLGTLQVPALARRIDLRDCPTMRGEAMETAIRRHYEGQMNLRFKTRLTLPNKPVSATGPDIDHEFAAFLAELAAELGT